jgi:hypothetical protein
MKYGVVLDHEHARTYVLRIELGQCRLSSEYTVGRMIWDSVTSRV